MPNAVQNPGLTASQNTALKAYLFRQFANDDNVQAFVDAYNCAAQGFIDWFNTVNLPVYSTLSGPLLYWVGEGLYGMPAAALASPVTPGRGAYNTGAFNTLALNANVPSTQTIYGITDDLYKRILTWNVYKGDGKRFCMRWLKRRIMRFLLGTNGVDPQPWLPGFAVGCENTTPISVKVAGRVLTVTIYQVLLSTLAQLAPNVLPLFAAAFTGGILDLPLRYQYIVNIVAALTVTISTAAVTKLGTTALITTPAVTVTPFAGSGSFLYVWSWQSGGAAITIATPAAASTVFSAAGLTPGETVQGVAQCVVTDTVTLQTVTVICAVEIVYVEPPALLLTLAPTYILAAPGEAFLLG